MARIKLQNLVEDISWIDARPHTQGQEDYLKEAIKATPKQAPKVKVPIPLTKYFTNLHDFLDKYNFKVTVIPWRYENDHHTINQVVDKDSYGFAIYSITPKRYIDESSFRGRLPNAKFAEEILMAIAEDYTMETLDRLPSSYPEERDHRFIENVAIQTSLRKDHNIHISMAHVISENEEFKYVYEVTYFPVSKQNEKFALHKRAIASGFWEDDVFDTYEKALEAAILKANSITHVYPN